MRLDRILLRRLTAAKNPEVAYLQDSVQMALSQLESRLQTIQQVVTQTTNTGTVYKWNYLHPTENMPSGISTRPGFCYAFDGSSAQLNDLSGYGNNLSRVGGTTVFNTPIDGQLGLGFDETYYLSAPAHSSLEMDRAMTIEAVVHVGQVTSVSDFIVGYGLNTDAGAPNSNVLHSLFYTANRGQWFYRHEHNSSGDNTDYTFPSFGPTAGYSYVAITRDSTGKILKLHQDGHLIASTTVANAPNKGGGVSNKVLAIGGDWGGTSFLNGVIMSLRGTAATFSPTQVSEVYSMLRGNA